MGPSPLTEPQVLAAAKNALDTAFTNESGYAVTDTQFSTSQWLDQKPISDEIMEQLAPFNHVRIGSGYPDLVGVTGANTLCRAVSGLNNAQGHRRFC